MPGLLADVNAQGHLDALVALCQTPAWRDVWRFVRPDVRRLTDLGLAPTVSDDVLSRACQREGLLLVTSNRNQKGPHSLGVTIAQHGLPDSLPVLTLADAERVLHDPAYAEKAVERLLEILLDVDRYRGAGRLWLP